MYYHFSSLGIFSSIKGIILKLLFCSLLFSHSKIGLEIYFGTSPTLLSLIAHVATQTVKYPGINFRNV